MNEMLLRAITGCKLLLFGVFTWKRVVNCSILLCDEILTNFIIGRVVIEGRKTLSKKVALHPALVLFNSFQFN